MSSKGWFNLEAAGGAIPETQFFEGEPAFKALGLTRTQRLYGFVGWYVFNFHPSSPFPPPPPWALGPAPGLYEPVVGSISNDHLADQVTFLLDVDKTIVLLLDWSLASSEP